MTQEVLEHTCRKKNDNQDSQICKKRVIKKSGKGPTGWHLGRSRYLLFVLFCGSFQAFTLRGSDSAV